MQKTLSHFDTKILPINSLLDTFGETLLNFAAFEQCLRLKRQRLNIFLILAFC